MKRFTLLSSWLSVIALLSVTNVLYADMLIYDNSNLNYIGYNGSHNGYLTEFLDDGSSSGGIVSKFKFDYRTDNPTVGTIQVSFYSHTDPDNAGDLIKTFALTNIAPTGGNFSEYEYIIPENDRFELPSGDFGYSFFLTQPSTFIALASGGNGNDDYFLTYDKIDGVFRQSDFSELWSSFSMQVYSIPEPTTMVLLGMGGLLLRRKR